MKSVECMLYIAYAKQAVDIMSLTSYYWKETKIIFQI